MDEEEKTQQEDLISVYIPQKNITVKFPSSMGEDEIREAINNNWSRLPDQRPGLLTQKIQETLTGQKAVSDWSLLQTAKEIPASIGELGAQALLWGTAPGALAMMAPKAISGIAGTLAGLGAGIKSVLHGGEFLTPALETGKKVIQGGEELTAKTIGKIPIVGKPISPAGEILHYGMGKLSDVLYEGIRKAQGEEGRKREGSEELARLAAGVTELALWPIIFTGVTHGYGYVKGKLDPLGTKPITVPLPKEAYETNFKSFNEFTDKLGFDLSDPNQAKTAKTAWKEYKTYQQYAQQHAYKVAKKAMADKELADVISRFKRQEISSDAYNLFKAFKGEQLTIEEIRDAIKDLPPDAQQTILREIEEQIGITLTPTTERTKASEEIAKEQTLADVRAKAEKETALAKQLEELDKRAAERFATKEAPEEVPAKIEKIIEREKPQDPKVQFIEFLKRKGYSDDRAYQLAEEVYPSSEYRTPIEIPEVRKPRERIVLTPEGKVARKTYYIETPEKPTGPEPEVERAKIQEYKEAETPRLILPSERGFVREPTPPGLKLEVPQKPAPKPEFEEVSPETISVPKEPEKSPAETIAKPATGERPAEVAREAKQVETSEKKGRAGDAEFEFTPPETYKGKQFKTLTRKEVDKTTDINYVDIYTPRRPYSISGEIIQTADGFVGSSTAVFKFPKGEIPSGFKSELTTISQIPGSTQEFVRTHSSITPGVIIGEAKTASKESSTVIIKAGDRYYRLEANNIDWVHKIYGNVQINVRSKENDPEWPVAELTYRGEPVAYIVPYVGVYKYSPRGDRDYLTAIKRHLTYLEKIQHIPPEEVAQATVLDEPIQNRGEYEKDLKNNKSPELADVVKAEKEAYGKATPTSASELLKSEKGALTVSFTTMETLKNELAKEGINFRDLPEPVKYFGDAKSIKQLRKLFILESTLRRKFPQTVPALDILHLMQTVPRKLLHEELKATLTFFRLRNPERVFDFIESLRLNKRTRSQAPITEEELRTKGFTDTEIQAIREIDSFTRRAMDLYVREMLLTHARLEGGYDKPRNVAEADRLIEELRRTGTAEHIIKQAEAIRDLHEKVDALADQYYFPAQRYGEYFVLAKTPDGKTGYLAHVDKLKEVESLARQLKKENPDWQVSWGKNYKPIYDIANELPPFLVTVLRSAIMDLEKAGALTLTGKDLLVALDQMVTKWGVGKAGFQVHMLPAKMVPGWEKNLKRSFASYMHRLTRAVTNSRLVPEFRKEMARFDTERDFNLIDILNRYYKDLMAGKQQFMMLNRFFGVWYLGLNLKSAAVNATQPLLMTYPWMLRYVGAPRATAIFAKAYKDALAYRTEKFSKIDPELKRIMDELVAKEEVYPQATRELAGYTKAEEPATPLWDIVQDAMMTAFKEAEMMNRYHAASAFYQIAKHKGLKGDEMFKFIENGIRDTQFDYSTMGLPSIARGPLRPFFVFRMFAYNWLARVKQLISERQYKALATMLSLHFLAGGISAIPFMSDIFRAIHWAYNKLADREDAFTADVRSIANKLSEEYGDQIADFFLYGLPGVAVGASIGGALNPLDVSMFDENGNPVYNIIKFLIGIPIDLPLKAVRTYQVWQQHRDGMRAIENMAPESVRNFMVAMRWYNEHGARAPSGELIYAPSLYDTIMKSLGFSPKDYIKAFEKRDVINSMLRERREKTTSLNEQIARALVLGDINKVQDLYINAITDAIKYAERGEVHRIILPDDGAIKRHILKMLYPEISEMMKAPKVARPEVWRLESLYGLPANEIEEEE